MAREKKEDNFILLGQSFFVVRLVLKLGSGLLLEFVTGFLSDNYY